MTFDIVAPVGSAALSGRCDELSGMSFLPFTFHYPHASWYLSTLLAVKVDFRDLGYYAASQDPNAGPFDPAEPASLNEEGLRRRKDGDYPQPLLFLECACRLIIELAGGSG